MNAWVKTEKGFFTWFSYLLRFWSNQSLWLFAAKSMKKFKYSWLKYAMDRKFIRKVLKIKEKF
jgi:hypothetical protein